MDKLLQLHTHAVIQLYVIYSRIQGRIYREVNEA